MDTMTARTAIRYTYPEFIEDVNLVHDRLVGWKPDIIFYLPRGGLTPAAYVAHSLGVKHVMDVSSLYPWIALPCPRKQGGYNYLLIDDISDTGESLKVAEAHIREYMKENEYFRGDLRTTTFWLRETTIFIPDVWCRKVQGTPWILFPWEVDAKEIHHKDSPRLTIIKPS